MFVKVFHTVFDVFGVGESRNGKVCSGSTKRLAVIFLGWVEFRGHSLGF